MRWYQGETTSGTDDSTRPIGRASVTVGIVGVVVATMLVVTASAVVAQVGGPVSGPDTATHAKAPPMWTVAHLSFGSTRLGSSGLNARLSTAGLPTLSRNAATIGGGASVVVGRVIVGASGHSLTSPEDVARGYRLRTGGGYGMIDLGIVAHAGNRTMLALVGGGGMARLDLRVRDTARTSFDSVTSSPRRGADLSGQTALWHVGASYDVRVRGNGGGSLVIGLRAGFLGRVGASRWRTDGDRLPGGPSALVDGPYLRLTVGSVLPNRRSGILPAIGSVARWFAS